MSLNRIYAATWEEILPSILTLLQQVELLSLGSNHVPALKNTPALQTLQNRGVVFLSGLHNFTWGPWIEGWKRNAQMFSREAYG